MPHLVVAADFERGLGTRSKATTPHFAVHHVVALVPAPGGLPSRRRSPELSTNRSQASALPVDSLAVSDAGGGTWIGAVVPKRHARRAVTRALLKRQIYAAAERHRDRLAPGLWIVRLRSPFDRSEFTSAASPALRRCARAELDALLTAAIPATAPA